MLLGGVHVLALNSLAKQPCVSCGAAGIMMCAVVLALVMLAGSNGHVVTRLYQLAIRGTFGAPFGTICEPSSRMLARS